MVYNNILVSKRADDICKSTGVLQKWTSNVTDFSRGPVEIWPPWWLGVTIFRSCLTSDRGYSQKWWRSLASQVTWWRQLVTWPAFVIVYFLEACWKWHVTILSTSLSVSGLHVNDSVNIIAELMNDDVYRRYHSNIKQEKIRKETFSQSAYAFSAIILRVTQASCYSKNWDSLSELLEFDRMGLASKYRPMKLICVLMMLN